MSDLVWATRSRTGVLGVLKDRADLTFITRDHVTMLERAPDLPRTVMEIGEFLLVEFWRNEGYLFRYNRRTGTLEESLQVPHMTFIHAVGYCDSARCRFKVKGQGQGVSAIWGVRPSGELAKVAEIPISGHWTFHQGADLLVSGKGGVLEIDSGKRLQEQWPYTAWDENG